MSGFWGMAMKMAADKAGQFGKQASSFGDKVANPGQALQQYGEQQAKQQPQQQQGGGKWQKYAGGPQDTSVGMSAANQQDPMYSQMMQQVMQQPQQQQQQQRQMMTPAGMPQMPGNIAPQNNLGSLIQRLLGGR